MSLELARQRISHGSCSPRAAVVSRSRTCAVAVVFRCVGSSMRSLAGEATRKCEALESALFNLLCNPHLDPYDQRGCLSVEVLGLTKQKTSGSRDVHSLKVDRWRGRTADRRTNT